jgi:hypothetical protein
MSWARFAARSAKATGAPKPRPSPSQPQPAAGLIPSPWQPLALRHADMRSAQLTRDTVAISSRPPAASVWPRLVLHQAHGQRKKEGRGLVSLCSHLPAKGRE